MATRNHHLASLTRYKRWANDLVFSSLSQLSAQDLAAPQPIVFGSLIATLHHTLAMDEVWQGNGAYKAKDTVTADLYETWLEAI